MPKRTSGTILAGNVVCHLCLSGRVSSDITQHDSTRFSDMSLFGDMSSCLLTCAKIRVFFDSRNIFILAIALFLHVPHVLVHILRIPTGSKSLTNTQPAININLVISDRWMHVDASLSLAL